MKSLLVCFDYDGVLADSYSNMLVVAGKAQKMVGAGRPPREGDFEVIENLTFSGIGRHLGMNGEEINRFAVVGFKLLQEYSGETVLFAGVREMLSAVALMARVCVVTANVAPVVANALRSRKADQHVDRVLGWDTPGAKADKIRLAMAEFGVAASKTFMVGDSMGDIRQGKAAGVKTIAVAWGYQPVEALLREQPDAVAQSPTEIVSLLPRLTHLTGNADHTV